MGVGLVGVGWGVGVSVGGGGGGEVVYGGVGSCYAYGETCYH